MAISSTAWPAPPPPARLVCDVLRDASITADWTRFRALAGQIVGTLPDPPVDELLDALARAVFDLAPIYAGRMPVLAGHALAVLADVEGAEALDAALFRQYYADARFTRPGVCAWRRPAPFQAIVETARRLRDAALLRSLLRGVPTTALLGGSTSYGGFYNVRGVSAGRAASDLDLVLVLDDTVQLPRIAERFLTLPGVARADLERLHRRAGIFAGRYDDGITMFSEKIDMWGASAHDPMLPAGLPGGYRISLHVLTRPVLRFVLVESAVRLDPDVAGATRTVRDYRPERTDRLDVQRTFAGHAVTLSGATQDAPDGCLRYTGAYTFDRSGGYCPGFIQSLLLMRPQPGPFWDDLDVADEVAAFRHKLRERLRLERARRPDLVLLFSLASVRRAILAPHVVRRLDCEDGH